MADNEKFTIDRSDLTSGNYDTAEQITVTTEGGANRLVKGEPEMLRLLHRIHVWRGTKPDMLLSRIDGALQALR